MRRVGFTLLEVVIALIILSTFAVACLQLRLSGLRAGQEIAVDQRVQRALDDVLALAIDRMLPDPLVERDDAGEVVRIVWAGDQLGDPFQCVAEIIEVPAPTLGALRPDDANGEPPASVRVRRYTATIDNRSAFILRPL